jgi:hypothetical protein
MPTEGWPLMRVSVSSFCAPISTRATSPTRSTDPSGVARSTMLRNWSGVVSVPWVCTLSWNCWSLSTGRAPMRPTGACTFCAWMALTTSDGDRLRLVSRWVSNQIRIE